MAPKPDPAKELEVRSRVEAATQALVELEGPASPDLKGSALVSKLDALKAAMEEAEAAKKAMDEGKKAKPNPLDVVAEDALNEVVGKVTPQLAELETLKKKEKDKARQEVMKAAMKAAPYTGDKQELEDAVKVAVEAGVADKDVADAQDKLTAMISFHKMLEYAASDLDKAAKGDAMKIQVSELEEKITECKENAIATLNKIVVELYLQLLTKPAPTAIATEALDASIAEAVELGVDEAEIKKNKKKSEEAKKAQNAKKIADRKAKKPPADPPKPPDPPEAHPDVQALKDKLLAAMASAEAKLAEAKSAGGLQVAMNAELLTPEALQDLETRAREEDHPNIAALAAAVKAAKDASCSEEVLGQGQKTLDEAIALRKATRTALAKSQLEAACAATTLETDVTELGKKIEVAKKEEVEGAFVEEKEQWLYMSYKAQSEGKLEPLAQPEELSHEGFQIIDPLRAALDEARKRGGHEELVIKGQAKLDFWITARDRRDKAKKALDASLAPPPCTVDQQVVQSCLFEATDSKLDPVLLKEATDKLKVAELAQRVYAKSKAPPGKLAIDVLEEELEVVGGGALAIEQAKQEAAAKLVADITEKIEAIKDTQDNQKSRDATLSKDVKKRATKQKAAGKDLEPMMPAWVRAMPGDEDSPNARASTIQSVADRQKEEKALLEEQLKEAQAALKEREEDVKKFGSTVVVPDDVVAFAQLKLKASKAADEMQQAQIADLLVLDIPRLQKGIAGCEVKFGEMPIAGMQDHYAEPAMKGIDCNVPKEELTQARARLRDASKAQTRQQRARTQLRVRVDAPTGTATFDLLVKLVAEAKAAGVEEELIARAELKLKKMEELAASSLRAGPLAFVSFHLPCLRSCVSQYAISLVEQAEEKRKEEFGRQLLALEDLAKYVGTWEKTTKPDKTLLLVDREGLVQALHTAAAEGLSQESMELARLKLQVIDKYIRDKAAGLIKDVDEEKKKAAAAAAAGGGAPKKKFKNYGYVKKVEEPTE